MQGREPRGGASPEAVSPDKAKPRSGRARSSHGVRLLEHVSALIGQSENLQETLDSIVKVVAERMRTEVCSIYLLDPATQTLTLWATTGLAHSSVGKVKMRTDEGLTGLVIETMKPVGVADAPVHPRFKFFPETGEERYHSFLGVPILERRVPLGVLVVQTLRRRQFTDDEIRLLNTIASQVSSVLVQARLLDSLKIKEREQADYRKRMLDAIRRLQAVERQTQRGAEAAPRKAGERLTGIAASPGFGIGRAHILHPQILFSDIEDRPCEDPEAELARFDAAVEVAGREIDHMRLKMQEILPEAEGKIFDAYLLMLRDNSLLSRVHSLIQEGSTAEFAVRRVVEGYLDAFEEIVDPYLQERAVDIKDIGQRLVRILLGIEGGDKPLPEVDTVLIARELTLTDLSEIEPQILRGIALATGAVTSHATILAKSFEIPTVVGIDRLMEHVQEGDELVVDGNAGVVYREPSPDVIREYERMERDYRAFNLQLESIRDLPAVTTDGHLVKLCANVGLVGDLVLAKRHGAEGIGLYRTEFPFLTFREFPSEREQLDIYRKVVAGMESRPVAIRTLDVGADKYPAYMHVPREENPFLGWRSIRVSLEMPELFTVQLRAIFQAATLGNVRLVLPMISSVEELLLAKEMIIEAERGLTKEGVAHERDLPLGIMIEVPSAVYLAPELAKHCDFFSIGTNDLIQYVLAVDRNNRKVAPLYQPLHPAVIGTIAQCVDAARAAGRPIAMCGEMAADPMCTLVLLGLGLDELSMEPFFIPVIKQLIRSVSYASAVELAQEVLGLHTIGDIKSAVFDAMRRLGVIELLDMYQ